MVWKKGNIRGFDAVESSLAISKDKLLDFWFCRHPWQIRKSPYVSWNMGFSALEPAIKTQKREQIAQIITQPVKFLCMSNSKCKISSSQFVSLNIVNFITLNIWHVLYKQQLIRHLLILRFIFTSCGFDSLHMHICAFCMCLRMRTGRKCFYSYSSCA